MDEKLSKYLDKMAMDFENCLKTNCVGIYVHGSIALDDFSWDRSDIDLLIVVNHALSREDRIELTHICQSYETTLPTKGLEISVVSRYSVEHVTESPYYEFHYSPLYKERAHHSVDVFIESCFGKDPDLPCHFLLVQKSGICIKGLAIERVFTGECEIFYKQSILHDLSADIPKEARDQACVILNACRTIVYCNERSFVSKREGGLRVLPFCERPEKKLIEDSLKLLYQGAEVSFNKQDIVELVSRAMNMLTEMSP